MDTSVIRYQTTACVDCNWIETFLTDDQTGNLGEIPLLIRQKSRNGNLPANGGLDLISKS